MIDHGGDSMWGRLFFIGIRWMSEWCSAGRHECERQLAIWRLDAANFSDGEAIMQFMLMSYVQENGWNQLTNEQKKQGMAAYMAYTEALTKAGAFKMGQRLGPSAEASTVRLKDGKAQILDGPYADAKEQLGGFFIIDVANREEAMQWAAKCPAVGHGVVEVRELPAW
jgi:hypothetical protein